MGVEVGERDPADERPGAAFALQCEVRRTLHDLGDRASAPFQELIHFLVQLALREVVATARGQANAQDHNGEGQQPDASPQAHLRSGYDAPPEDQPVARPPPHGRRTT